MVLNEDWTAAIRACPTVREYILIGEADDGCCGLPWETWGVDPDVSWAGDCSSTSSEDEDNPVDLEVLGRDIEEETVLQAVTTAWGVRESEQGRKRDRAEMESARDDAVKLRSTAPSSRLRRVYLAAPAKTPFGREGFTRMDLDHEMGRWQLCRTDQRWATTRNSTTVAFVRDADE